jgi:hypothetical protein
MTGTKLSFIIYTQYTLDFSVAEHYGLRNTTCWRSKDVASARIFPFSLSQTTPSREDRANSFGLQMKLPGRL